MDFMGLLAGAAQNIWIFAVPFIIVLSILVFVHEWGHYIAARLCGVRVEVFSIGFGHELFGYNDKHGTRWKVALFPLGGYVKLFGDIDPDLVNKAYTTKKNKGKPVPAPKDMTAAERQEAFFNKPVWKRAVIVFAGPAINYIFAIILLSALFATNGQPVTPPIAAAVVKGSSADIAGFKPHDVIKEIDGKKLESFEDIRRAMLISLDQPRQFTVERNGRELHITATPEKAESEDRFGFKQSRGKLGLVGPNFGIDARSITAINGKAVGDEHAIMRDLQSHMGSVFTITMAPKKSEAKPDIYIIRPRANLNENIATAGNKDYGILYITPLEDQVLVKYSPVGAVVKAVQEAWNITAATLEAIGQMITGTRSASELGGIIRIGALAGDMAQQGMIALVLFTALLSINLGLINLFPIPVLDGGHLVFYALEAIRGRPVPEQIQEYAFRFGMALLIALMVFANLNDIVQLLL